MIGRVKKWLGIEGVKLELILPEEIKAADGVIIGDILFQSMNPQQVTRIKLVLIEKYSRGRSKEKLIDEYELAQVELVRTIEISPEHPATIPFKLPFQLVRSNVDEFGRKNFVFGGLAQLAKMAQAVKSEYRVEAEASVKGVALNPFDRKSIVIK
ncbi:MAG TPA: sporulation protein [Saprospiraceae bacterium]|nr:sporulation protein [Saprospiraceae bacterium]HMQ82574.1 sporulation protein [Saprospiraceae bacterium]